MLEAVFIFGLIILVGILLILIKLPKKLMLWLLGKAIWLDIIVTILALIIHWGTMTGLMAAAVAGMMCSLTTSAAKYFVGYIAKRKYHPGVFNILS